MIKPLVLKVNGEKRQVEVDPDTPLLYVLRNELQLYGPKFGCGLQQCGSCMVLLDGKAQPSCMLTVSSAAAFNIITIEGLAKNGKLHPVQKAFADEQAAQCGYCLNGMVINAVSLLNEKPTADDSYIREGLQRSLCRCGSHARVIRAVKRAQQELGNKSSTT